MSHTAAQPASALAKRNSKASAKLEAQKAIARWKNEAAHSRERAILAQVGVDMKRLDIQSKQREDDERKASSTRRCTVCLRDFDKFRRPSKHLPKAQYDIFLADTLDNCVDCITKSAVHDIPCRQHPYQLESAGRYSINEPHEHAGSQDHFCIVLTKTMYDGMMATCKNLDQAERRAATKRARQQEAGNAPEGTGAASGTAGDQLQGPAQRPRRAAAARAAQAALDDQSERMYDAAEFQQ